MFARRSTSESQGPSSTSRALWPLLGTATAVCGFIATAATDIHVGSGSDIATQAIVPDISQDKAHLSVVFGYLTVALLLVLAACWRHHAERAWSTSVAASVVTLGFVSTAGGLTLGYGFRGALAVYLPGGSDHGLFDENGLFIYYVMNDFASYIPWLGVVVAAGAFAWLGLKERVIPMWIGAFSVLPVLGVVLLLVLTGLPGFPALMGVPWMLVAFTGLYFARVKAPSARPSTARTDLAPAL